MKSTNPKLPRKPATQTPRGSPLFTTADSGRRRLGVTMMLASAAILSSPLALALPSEQFQAAASFVPPHSEAGKAFSGMGLAAASDRGERTRRLGGGEGGGGAVNGAAEESESFPVPKVPFCRAGADVANMWMPVWDRDNQAVATAKRVVVFGGKGVDYYRTQANGELSYLNDMWTLHITNTGFRWNKITPHGKFEPSPRWQTGDGVVYDRSLVIFGGDDQTTNQVGGLGDLWVYSPRVLRTQSAWGDASQDDEWKSYERGGDHPGERRNPSLTMINSTLLLQGGSMTDGEENERCDSRLFLLDLADPKGEWREGASLPGDCGVGQTMDTVTLKKGDKTMVRAVVFGGCQRDSEGIFSCSNDLHAYDLAEDSWVTIGPKSDMDSSACATVDIDNSSTPTDLFTNSTIEDFTDVDTSNSGADGGTSSSNPEPKKVTCPGKTMPRPLGRYAHATAYIESNVDAVHALFVFGGRENADDLTPLGDLWMFDFKKMRWSEISTAPGKKAPVNRFSHSLTVWKGGAGDGVASLVVFGGETITSTGQAAYLNDVWLYTPDTGAWREVSQSDCHEGASGIARGGHWTALVALVTLLTLVVVVQCLLHHICPHYEPPIRRRRRRRRKTEDGRTSLSSRRNGATLATTMEQGEEDVARPVSAPSLSKGLLGSSGSKPSYQAVSQT